MRGLPVGNEAEVGQLVTLGLTSWRDWRDAVLTETTRISGTARERHEQEVEEKMMKEKRRGNGSVLLSNRLRGYHPDLRSSAPLVRTRTATGCKNSRASKCDWLSPGSQVDLNTPRSFGQTCFRDFYWS